MATMKKLLIKFPGALLDEVDQALPEGARSQFIREAVECLLRVQAEHLAMLRRYAQKEGFSVWRVIREAVELYVSQKRGEIEQAIQEPKVERPKGRKGSPGNRLIKARGLRTKARS